MKRSFGVITGLTCLLLLSCTFILDKAGTASAVSASDWQAGRIIDDQYFTDSSSMSVDQIQAFLNNLVPNCDTNGTQPATDYGRSDLTHAQYAQARGWPAPPYACLRNYYEVPKTVPGAGMPDNSYNHGGGYFAGGLSAAQLIYNAAQQYRISPKVLLVKIKAESAGPLTNDSWPLPSQYTYAMGAHCPDSGPNRAANCDPNYSGFSIQISEAASLMRYYLDNMNQPWWPYKKVGNNTILYNPDPACGSSVVNIVSQGTAALYTYTPYQPSNAALAAGYGTAPSCGAYGNRNFWLYYNDWFGSTITSNTNSPHPDGTLVSYDGSVYLVQSGGRHYITGAVFQSYGYRWQDIKPATFGDVNLPVSWPVNTFSPGSLFRTATSGVYVSVYENNSWVKQSVTYQAYMSLGYNWNQVQVVSDNDLPATTSTGTLAASAHPNGTLIKTTDGRVYHIDNGTLRYISAPVFVSHRWSWDAITPATATDLQLPAGADELYQMGTVLSDGSNLYVVSLPASGPAIKRPIGPWGCYADAFRYGLGDITVVRPADLPAATGPLITCQ